MNAISAKSVRFDDGSIQRQGYELPIDGIHWNDLDEDISITGSSGQRDFTRGKKSAGEN